MKISLWQIYYRFMIIGIQLLGGGYVIDFYAISQSIPGIIAANISTFTGYKLRGKSGAAAAVLGIATSPIIAILIIATLMDKLLNFPFIQSIF